MPSFSLITEGITDQVLITFILTGHYGDEPDITEAQPLRDETDESRQANHAGWEQVFTYCSTDFFEQQFYTNDYVIIQIDTDVCGQTKFDINLKTGNKDRPLEEILSDVKNHIIGHIGREIYDLYSDRIIFAISVHSLECWLLPLYAKSDLEKSRVRKCENHLIKALERHDLVFEKKYRPFQIYSKPYLDQRTLSNAVKYNGSLDKFVGSLPPG